MLRVGCLQSHPVVGKADVTLVVGTFLRLQFCSLCVMIDAFFEVLHYKGNTRNQLVKHRTSVNVLRSSR